MVYALSRNEVDDEVDKIKMQEEKGNAAELAEPGARRTRRLLRRTLLKSPVRPDIEFIRSGSDENQRLVK